VLKIKIIVVDRTRSAFLSEGESFYLDRLGRYALVEWIETKPARIRRSSSPQKILDEEGLSIAKRLHARDYIFVLDRLGKPFDSEGLAARIDQLSVSNSQLTFIIGGPLGLSKEIYKKAHEILSLSSLTFTHEMSRLILLEQLYRSFTIINNEKYHK